ncbi:hypothetical protein PUN28_013461 [Cardiocondyla obscurior]|uniref:Uncharacterized protein n=1 Tax=Cardiocondyla obscurior TaxID=286306 RepID=A0AAW2F1H0_9HYME
MSNSFNPARHPSIRVLCLAENRRVRRRRDHEALALPRARARALSRTLILPRSVNPLPRVKEPRAHSSPVLFVRLCAVSAAKRDLWCAARGSRAAQQRREGWRGSPEVRPGGENECRERGRRRNGKYR